MDKGKLLDDFYIKIHTTEQALRSKRDARSHLRAMDYHYILSAADKKQLKEFWSPYQRHPDIMWYELLCAHENVFDPGYIPNSYWYQDIIPHYNKILFRKAYVDKCFAELLFPKSILPRTLVRCMSGTVYGPDGEIITQSDAACIIKNAGRAIIKPSIDSGSGRGIEFVDPEDGINEISDKLRVQHDNYIVQEVVQQHSDLNKIHSNSLNTIRLLTFFYEGKVRLLSAVLRMGQGDSRVDNIGAGGLQCAICGHGFLSKYAATADRKWVSCHPGGLIFENYQLPSFDDALAMVQEQHSRLGHFKIIGWDVAITASGNPIIIEFNLHPAQNQMTCGPTFAEMTGDVLSDVYLHNHR